MGLAERTVQDLKHKIKCTNSHTVTLIAAKTKRFFLGPWPDFSPNSSLRSYNSSAPLKPLLLTYCGCLWLWDFLVSSMAYQAYATSVISIFSQVKQKQKNILETAIRSNSINCAALGTIVCGSGSVGLTVSSPYLWRHGTGPHDW